MIDRRLQLRLWLLALDRFEIKLRGAIARARNKYIRTASTQYENNHGSIPAWVLEQHRGAISGLLQSHYELVIPHFGGMALKQVKSRRISTKAAHNLFTSFMYEWIRTEALRKASMIAGTDYDDVLGKIEAGIAAGEGVASIARSIREAVELTTYRAATIARTETHNAATFGSVETARTAQEELGIQLVKAWLPTLDDRTRPAHRAMQDKDPIPLGERFSVDGESMDRPGDPSASPDNVINCRCALAYEEKL